jgi:hypothetical protein
MDNFKQEFKKMAIILFYIINGFCFQTFKLIVLIRLSINQIYKSNEFLVKICTMQGKIYINLITKLTVSKSRKAKHVDAVQFFASALDEIPPCTAPQCDHYTFYALYKYVYMLFLVF